MQRHLLASQNSVTGSFGSMYVSSRLSGTSCWLTDTWRSTWIQCIRWTGTPCRRYWSSLTCRGRKIAQRWLAQTREDMLWDLGRARQWRRWTTKWRGPWDTVDALVEALEVVGSAAVGRWTWIDGGRNIGVERRHRNFRDVCSNWNRPRRAKGGLCSTAVAARNLRVTVVAQDQWQETGENDCRIPKIYYQL